MYKIEIELGWEERVTIETDDFNKIALIQEFIALQEDCNWCEEEDLVFVDEEGLTWVYDADLDEWVEYEAEEEEDEEDEEDYE
jgi:hypothetical protein